ncbi:MAG: serine hydrolase [Bacteroidia bacterium]
MGHQKVSYTITAALIVVSCGATFFASRYLQQRISEKTNQTISQIESKAERRHYKVDRLKGYRLIMPLLYTQQTEEPSTYSDMKAKLTNYIEQLQNSKKLITASVFLKDFDEGDWMCINDNETYYPGSLIKVPGLITYLKMAEKTPGFLDKKFIFGNPHHKIPNQTYSSQQIQPGNEYTVRQLLKYMIAYSDNNATYLLNKNVDLVAFHKLFDDLDIPKLNNGNTQITAKNVSLFLNVLFNGSYLTKENSEFAVELLEECDFKLGMIKGLPVNTVVAHKFGEMGDSTTRQLHESGLIYVNDNPYLLTIMTKGYDVKDLPEILSTMSKMVYQDFINKERN